MLWSKEHQQCGLQHQGPAARCTSTARAFSTWGGRHGGDGDTPAAKDPRLPAGEVQGAPTRPQRVGGEAEEAGRTGHFCVRRF